MVDDDNVGRLRLVARGAQEAGSANVGAVPRALGGYSVPRGESGGTAEIDFGAVAGFGVRHPQHRLGDNAGLVGFEVGGLSRAPPALAAQIVSPALQLAESQFFSQLRGYFGQRPFERGQVFAYQLLLQVDGVCGYDNALVVGGGVYGGGEQVGERFSHAGAGFDDEASAGVDGFGDGFRHVYLLRALFEGGDGLGERAARGEGAGDVVGVHRRLVLGRAQRSGLRQARGEGAGVHDGRRGGVKSGARRREFLGGVQQCADIPPGAPPQTANLIERDGV